VRVIKPQRLSLLHRVVGIQGQSLLTIATLALFDFESPTNLGSESVLWTLAGKELPPGIVLDECLPKRNAEVLVSDRCHPPSGEQAVSYVRLRIGVVDKQIAVIGNREWRDGVPTPPLPFASMPIEWSRAFGGEGFPRNPLGVGAEGVGVRYPLPNLEDPRRLIRSPRERQREALFDVANKTTSERHVG
jgi:hypothetical protein